MLILEKFRNKFHRIWITIDGEKRDTKFDCRLKGEKQIVLHSNRPGPALHWRPVFVNHRIICAYEPF
jgi:hypothetical protein